jgi:phospholipase D1/2
MRALTLAGNKNWAAYVDPSANAPLPYGHLLTYPNWVDTEGNVQELQDYPEFPDLGGRILGTKSNVLPSILTT